MSEFWPQVIEVLGSFLVVGGALLMFLAAVGTLRLPDLPSRMHASSKAGALGGGMIMLTIAIVMPAPAIWAKVLAIVGFLIITAPVAAHAIGRASFLSGVPLWEKTVKNDLEGRYNFETGALEGRFGPGANEEVITETEEPAVGVEAQSPAIESQGLREQGLREGVAGIQKGVEALQEGMKAVQEELKALQEQRGSAKDDAEGKKKPIDEAEPV